MADEKDWPNAWDVVRIPFCFVPHGAPEPTEWMARHPSWFKIPATFIPRGAWPPTSAAPAAGDAPGIRVADRSEYRPQSRLPSELHTSRRGKEFIFVREAANPEITKHTHWPGAESGVTLGPGYDMKFRTPDQIVSDLTAIGVDYGHARVLAAAGKPPDGSSRFGLQGQAAKAFAERHAKEVTLTVAQQRALLEYVLPAYEAQVRRLVHVPLTQNQFDALVSFDYSRGILFFQEIARTLNNEGYKAAADMLEHFDDTRGVGLQIRRIAESDLFRRPDSSHRSQDLR